MEEGAQREKQSKTTLRERERKSKRDGESSPKKKDSKIGTHERSKQCNTIR